MISGFLDCSINRDEPKAYVASSPSPRNTSREARPRRQSGPSDIKSVSKILQQAGYPLTEPQINYLLTLKEGPEFREKMKDVLTERQLSVLNENTRRRR